MTIPYCFDYCNLVTYFEIRTGETSDFFFFKISLAIWVPLKVNMNFNVNFSISEKKKAFGILIRDYIESVNCFE